MIGFLRKLGWLGQRSHKEDELREELQFHLDEEAAERQAKGLTGEAARFAAQRDLGNVTLVRERARAAWGWTTLEQLLQDIRYAARAMRNHKAFTALAALSLALGIGANTAIFSFMDSLLLRSLPVQDPKSLVVLNWRMKRASGYKYRSDYSVVHSGSGSIHYDPKIGVNAGIFPYPAFEMFQKQSEAVFDRVFAYYPARTVNLMARGQAEVATGEYVSGDYFQGVGIPPGAGRLIQSDDDRAGAPAVAVLSFACAQKRFGNVTEAVGQTIRINNTPFVAIGVAPPGFFGVDPGAAPDFYIPIHTNLLLSREGPSEAAREYLQPNYYWIEMIGRLRPGVSMAQAQAALSGPFHQWVASTASNDRERAYLPELMFREGASGLDSLRRQYSKPLYVLLAMVALILAIACANIANLLLARAAARKREMAVRLSMGAGRLRVIRQLLTESVLLASLGGGLGVLFAIWGIRFLTLLLANGQDNFTLHAQVNWHVLGAAIALSMLTGIVFGLAPAIQSTRVDVIPALKEIRTSQTRSRSRISLGQALLVAQIGISLLMLVAASLFVRTLSNLQAVQLGFNRENVLLFQLDARKAGHKDPEILSFYGDLQKRFNAIPGVRTASLSHSPLVGEGSWYSGIAPVGKKPIDATHILMAGPRYLETMQIPLIAGRDIDEHDQPGSTPVAIVNEAYVKTNFGDENPLGRRLRFEATRQIKVQDIEIVGVAKNARYGEALQDKFPEVVFLPFVQGSYYPVEGMTYALRTSGDPLGYAGAVRDIVRHADPRVPVDKVRTQAAAVDRIMNQEIIFARLCTGFAILALTIACVGLYGSMSYNVARRTGEIGIRMALGAPRGQVVWMVLGEVFALAAAGLAISVPTALAGSKLVASFLFGMKPNDPVALTMAIVTLLSAAVVAGYLPARNAARIDPMAALRHE